MPDAGVTRAARVPRRDGAELAHLPALPVERRVQLHIRQSESLAFDVDQNAGGLTFVSTGLEGRAGTCSCASMRAPARRLMPAEQRCLEPNRGSDEPSAIRDGLSAYG